MAALFSAALIMCTSVYGCSDKDISSSDEKNVTPVEEQVRGELTEEEKNAAKEKGISEERYCTSEEAITKIAEDVLKQYCEGLAEADHEKCFTVFPDFYKQAVEAENKEYGETNEEYMQSIKQGFINDFGEDFTLSASVNTVLQISDESLNEMEKTINESFGIEIKLDDLYDVYFSETLSGSLNSETNPLQFLMLYIDGKYYLYDSYYEKSQENA